MDMKEKQPITPVTPVPTPSVAGEAEANRNGPSTTKPNSDSAKGSDMPLDGSDKLPNLSMAQLENIQDTSDEYIDPAREPKMYADNVSVYYGPKRALQPLWPATSLNAKSSFSSEIPLETEIALQIHA